MNLTLVYLPRIKKSVKETSVLLYLLTENILLVNSNDLLFRDLIKEFTPKFVLYGIDVNNPHVIQGDFQSMPINVNTFDISKLASYVDKLNKLYLQYKNTKVKQSKKLDYNLVNFYNFLSTREYITEMFINDKYTASDIDTYKLLLTENVMELEGFLKYFYLYVNTDIKNIENIIEKYQDKPYYLLQMIYKKYIDPNYTLIKEVNAYSDELTIIV